MEGQSGLKGKILVVDDVECSRGILRVLLRNDYEVVEATDGFEAVDALKRHGAGICCVLLDIKMPGMDGYGVMDFMRDSGIADHVPVIALTAISDSQGLIRCFTSGAADVIEKPFKEDLLRYKIEWTISRFQRMNGNADGRNVQSYPQLSPRIENAVTRHLREAYGLDTQAEVDDMYKSFLRTLDGCVERLLEQVENPDMNAVRDVTHDIFGFAQSAGAVDLDDMTRMLNTCAKADDPVAVRAGIRRIVELRKIY